MSDLKLNQQVYVLAFAAENSLSFSMVLKLIDFAKNLAEDRKALRITENASNIRVGVVQNEARCRENRSRNLKRGRQRTMLTITSLVCWLPTSMRSQV